MPDGKLGQCCMKRSTLWNLLHWRSRTLISQVCGFSLVSVLLSLIEMLHSRI